MHRKYHSNHASIYAEVRITNWSVMRNRFRRNKFESTSLRKSIVSDRFTRWLDWTALSTMHVNTLYIYNMTDKLRSASREVCIRRWLIIPPAAEAFPDRVENFNDYRFNRCVDSLLCQFHEADYAEYTISGEKSAYIYRININFVLCYSRIFIIRVW